MKFYRLTETHHIYGIAGMIIHHEVYVTIPHFDRALYEKIDEHGSGHMYKVEVTPIPSGGHPVLYYLENYGELTILLGRLLQRCKNKDMPIIIPRTSSVLAMDSYRANVIYRKEWDTE